MAGKMQEGIYSIQEHHATHLHWDLRLEKDGILKSWALPKMPTNGLGIKILAIQTEDHDMDYAFFEGEIAEGNYGAGTVKVFDKGICKFLEYDENKKCIVEIRGKKLNGLFILLKLRKKMEWLFFKKK